MRIGSIAKLLGSLTVFLSVCALPNTEAFAEPKPKTPTDKSWHFKRVAALPLQSYAQRPVGFAPLANGDFALLVVAGVPDPAIYTQAAMFLYRIGRDGSVKWRTDLQYGVGHGYRLMNGESWSVEDLEPFPNVIVELANGAIALCMMQQGPFVLSSEGKLLWLHALTIDRPIDGGSSSDNANIGQPTQTVRCDRMTAQGDHIFVAGEAIGQLNLDSERISRDKPIGRYGVVKFAYTGERLWYWYAAYSASIGDECIQAESLFALPNGRIVGSFARDYTKCHYTISERDHAYFSQIEVHLSPEGRLISSASAPARGDAEVLVRAMSATGFGLRISLPPRCTWTAGRRICDADPARVILERIDSFGRIVQRRGLVVKSLGFSAGGLRWGLLYPNIQPFVEVDGTFVLLLPTLDKPLALSVVTPDLQVVTFDAQLSVDLMQMDFKIFRYGASARIAYLDNEGIMEAEFPQSAAAAFARAKTRSLHR